MNKQEATGVGCTGQRNDSHRAMAEPCRDRPDLHAPVAGGVDRSDLSPGNDGRLPCLVCAAQNRQPADPQAITVENSLSMAPAHGRDELSDTPACKGLPVRIPPDDGGTRARAAE